jgi:hypothetical protein
MKIEEQQKENESRKRNLEAYKASGKIRFVNRPQIKTEQK